VLDDHALLGARLRCGDRLQWFVVHLMRWIVLEQQRGVCVNV